MKESGTSKSIEKFLTRRRYFCYIVRIFVDDPAILRQSLRTVLKSSIPFLTKKNQNYDIKPRVARNMRY